MFRNILFVIKDKKVQQDNSHSFKCLLQDVGIPLENSDSELS